MSTNEFPIVDSITSLSPSEVKLLLTKEGVWPQYTKRLKNLEKIESEFWDIYNKESDLSKKASILISLGDMQSIIAKYYAALKEILENNGRNSLTN